MEKVEQIVEHDIGRYFIQWHFFAPFFAAILGLLIAVLCLFSASMRYFLTAYKRQQWRETTATVQNALAKKQEYLRNYLLFIKDDADFKNAFYFASEETVSLRKPLDSYLSKYKSLLKEPVA
jgi:hypothetical protein